MLLALMFLISVEQDTNAVELKNRTIYEQALSKCHERLGQSNPNALYDCLDDNAELKLAMDSCLAKYGEDGQKLKNCFGIIDATNMPVDELISTITARHPFDYYTLSMRLFVDGRKDEASFWFYVGQLRWRIRILCHPEFEPSGEPAASYAMNETLGQSINQYIGGYPSKYIRIMQNVLDWDKVQINIFETQKNCRRQSSIVRKGLSNLISYVKNNRKYIATERTKNGLPNYE